MNQQILNREDFYKTSDLALATTLSLFHPIEKIEKANPRKAFFVFKKSENLDELLEKYWKGQLQVEPALYFQQLKILKARLYSEGL
jgi:hypothetical protein